MGLPVQFNHYANISVVPALKEVIIQDIIVEIGQTKIIDLLVCCRNTT
jgi:hypothetical protein